MSLFKYKIINEQIRIGSVFSILKRFKSKKKVSEKLLPTNRALNHFDDFYKLVFGDRWPSIRLALLSKPKYLAVINNFGEVEKTEDFFQNQGAFPLKSFLEVQKNFKQRSKKKKNPKDDSGVNEAISQQLESEEIKEFEYLHPEGIEFKLKGENIKQEDETNKSDEEYIYKPEDARTSLDFDLNKAQIDETRQIMPDSKLLEANLKEFIPATTLRGAESFIPESDYYKYYQPKTKTPVNIEEEFELDFPDNLKVYAFDRGDITDFPDPHRNIADLYDYLKIDGSELLAALALGVQPNDSVLDMCSSSGNIAYCLFQTLRPKFLVCAQDKDNNIYNLFKDHLMDFSQMGKNNVLYVTSSPIESLNTDYLFDKVLVNAPSTEDKTSLFENEGNIFHVLETKNRLTLPEVQCKILTQGLKLVRPGGTVLYTSRTLSPIQNDGVVNQAICAMWEENKQEFVIKDLTPALRHTSLFFKYGDYLNLKFGTLVVPFLPVNFGPRYFCKIVKKEVGNEDIDGGENS